MKTSFSHLPTKFAMYLRQLKKFSRVVAGAKYYSSAPSTALSMSIGLNADQLEFQSLALQFAKNEMFPKASKWDQEKIYPKDVIMKCAELGFGGILVSNDVGGLGLSRLDANVIFEALSMGCTSTTALLTLHNMAARIIDMYGSEELRHSVLPEVVTCEKFCSYCLTEAGSGSDAASLTTKAIKVDDTYVLNGEKSFISGGGQSDYYVVLCRTGSKGPKGISCFLVAKGTPGLSFGKAENKMGWNSQPTSTVIFDNCVIPARNLIGEEGKGFQYAMQALEGGRLNIAACSLGAAQQCLELTKEYITTRKQFGKSIAAFQNTQFKMAEMVCSVQAARTMLRQAATLMDQDYPGANVHCAMAKRMATDVGFQVCNEAMQLYGGYGYLKDYPIERYMRDSRIHQILGGTNEIMRLIVARNILQRE